MPAINASGQSPAAGSVDIALSHDLQDGDSAHVVAIAEGIDSVTGDKATYIREWTVTRAAGVTSALAGVGWNARHTAEQDTAWPGPTAITDVGGQAGVTLEGDVSNITNWRVRGLVTRFPTA